MNIEIMRNTLYKAYLDDFQRFVSKLGGTTQEVMGDLLAFEVRQFFQTISQPQSCHSLVLLKVIKANFGLLARTVKVSSHC